MDRRVARIRAGAGSRHGALRLVIRLIDLSRFEDADAVLETALQKWPGRPRLLHLHATSAHVSGRFQLALERWERLRAIRLNDAAAWCGVAANARMLDELPEALATIEAALRRFPDDLGVSSEAARIFGALGRFQAAADQWGRLVALKQVHQDWYQGYAFSLLMTGRFVQAEAILDRAARDYPDDRDLLATRAVLAMEREDWNTALALWRVYRKRHPDDQAGWEGQGKTIAAIHAARTEVPEEEEPADVVRVEFDLIEDDPTRTLLLGFESLGADCEFGLVQRRFGAEPLGLLRFNDVRLPSLMAALASSFEGMGEARNTSLVTSRNGEIYVADKRWGLGMHTFLFASGHDVSTMKPKMLRRVAYLRDKLLNDLKAAEKVWVFKSDAIELQALHSLHAALRAFGPVRLLHVRRASVPLADQPVDVAPGRVYQLDDDLFVGFLSRMGNAGLDWDIAFDEWVAICAGLHDAPPLLCHGPGGPERSG